MAQLSFHARQRASQRGLAQDEIDFVFHFGRKIFRTGIRFIFLGERDIPERYQRSHGYLAGSTMLVSKDGTILTVYKNPEAIRVIKKKSKNKRKTPQPA
ncbi:MAG: hypothetical protein JWM80_1862 [Cyanobacteria bacterium RYN_339]|nr:hypothetical protein [Cyanobacteria bacterium RYN_339]